MDLSNEKIIYLLEQSSNESKTENVTWLVTTFLNVSRCV